MSHLFIDISHLAERYINLIFHIFLDVLLENKLNKNVIFICFMYYFHYFNIILQNMKTASKHLII